MDENKTELVQNIRIAQNCFKNFIEISSFWDIDEKIEKFSV